MLTIELQPQAHLIDGPKQLGNKIGRMYPFCLVLQLQNGHDAAKKEIALFITGVGNSHNYTCTFLLTKR